MCEIVTAALIPTPAQRFPKQNSSLSARASIKVVIHTDKPGDGRQSGYVRGNTDKAGLG